MIPWDLFPVINLILLLFLAYRLRLFVLKRQLLGIDRMKNELPQLVIDALVARAEWREMLQQLNAAEVRLNVLEERLDRHLDTGR